MISEDGVIQLGQLARTLDRALRPPCLLRLHCLRDYFDLEFSLFRVRAD